MPPKCEDKPVYVCDENGRFWELGRIETFPDVPADIIDRLYLLSMESNNHRRMRGKKPIRWRQILKGR